MSISLATKGVMAPSPNAISLITFGVITNAPGTGQPFVPTFIVPPAPVIESDIFNKSANILFTPSIVVGKSPTVNILSRKDATLATKKDVNLLSSNIDLDNKEAPDLFNKKLGPIFNKKDPKINNKD
jgi:hypothetical protein